MSMSYLYSKFARDRCSTSHWHGGRARSLQDGGDPAIKDEDVKQPNRWRSLYSRLREGNRSEQYCSLFARRKLQYLRNDNCRCSEHVHRGAEAMAESGTIVASRDWSPEV